MFRSKTLPLLWKYQPASQLLLLFVVKFRVRAPSSGWSSHKLQEEKIMKLSVTVPAGYNSMLLLLESIKSKIG